MYWHKNLTFSSWEGLGVGKCRFIFEIYQE